MTELLGGKPPVPFIQMSDLNDKDIINGTRKMATPDGQIVLVYPLPSGEELTSSPLAQDGIGKMMIVWIEAVKERIVADAQAAQDAALRKTRESQMATQNLDDHIPATEPTTAELHAAGVPAVRQPPAPEPPYVETSPRLYARAKVKELKESARMLRKQIEQRAKALAQTELLLEQWEGVVAGLKGKA